MFIKLHDHTGQVLLLNPQHIVTMTGTTRVDSKTRLGLVGSMVVNTKETMGEIYSLCDDETRCTPGVLLDDDLAKPLGAESLTPEWVKAVDAQIKKE